MIFITLFVFYSIWNHLCKLVSRGQTTVIITTHYIEEARQSHSVSLNLNWLFVLRIVTFMRNDVMPKKIGFCNRLFLFLYIVRRYTLRTQVFQACFLHVLWIIKSWFEDFNLTGLKSVMLRDLWCHTTSNSLKNTGNTITAIRFLFYNSRGPFSAFICKSTCFKTDENTYMI